jgi:putative ABC transport system permease protein
MLVAFAGVRFLVELGPVAPLVKEASIDLRVLLFTLLTALTAGIVFGVGPIFKALKVQANDALKETGTKHTGSAVESRMRSILTVAEVALALMLLIGAGLLMRSFMQLRVVDVGFDADNLLTASLRAPQETSGNADRIVTFFEDVITRIERMPGVKGAAAASAVPLLGNESSSFRVEGSLSSDRGQDIVYAEQPKITPSYFRTMGIRLVKGREFTPLDTARSQPVAVVSESLANTYWPGEDAIGKRLMIDDRQWRSVVGIVHDIRHDGLDRPPRPTIYIPLAQYSRPALTLLVRTDSNPAQFIGPTREAVAEVEKNQPLFGIQTMEQTLSKSVSMKRFLLMLIGIFAAIAIVLGTVGVYGLLAYFVSHRSREIGIRIALGAKRSEVVWHIVKHAAVLGLTGVGIGVLGALALSRTLSGMLFGVSPTDVWTFTVAPVLLFLIVLLASFLPGRAAARVDPMTALRGE